MLLDSYDSEVAMSVHMDFSVVGVIEHVIITLIVSSSFRTALNSHIRSVDRSVTSLLSVLLMNYCIFMYSSTLLCSV